MGIVYDAIAMLITGGVLFVGLVISALVIDARNYRRTRMLKRLASEAQRPVDGRKV